MQHNADLEQNTNLQQNTDLPQNTVNIIWSTNALLIPSTLFGPQIQNPFDPVNIIWPTNAQILLYKRIGVKTNMKKHDEKKQGTTGSISSRECVKERKDKSKEMTNTTGNA